MLVLLSFAAVLISSTVVVVGTVFHLWDWYSRHANWRTAEYRKLDSLIAGFSLEQFKTTLGSPIFVQVARKSHLVESTFRGRGFWVQTISDNDGVVRSYAVTSCSRTFRPSFRLGTELLVLQQTTFAEVARQFGGGVVVDYFLSGATANSYFLESFYGGNPTNYKTYGWGIDDACPARSDPYGYFGHRRPLFQEYHGELSGLPRVAREFRAAAAVNTYVETAPGADIEQIRRSFQIGVDRILVRTVPPAA